MKQGFSLLKTNPLGFEPDFATFENQTNLVIPPTYKLFVSLFDMNKDALFRDSLYLEKENRFSEYSDIRSTYDPENIILCDFISLENALYVLKNGYNKGNMVIDNGYIPFAETGWSLMLHIGTKDIEKDMVILEYDGNSYGENTGLNVFQFIQTLVYFESEKILERSTNNFYRNWREDFWRVR